MSLFKRCYYLYSFSIPFYKSKRRDWVDRIPGLHFIILHTSQTVLGGGHMLSSSPPTPRWPRTCDRVGNQAAFRVWTHTCIHLIAYEAEIPPSELKPRSFLLWRDWYYLLKVAKFLNYTSSSLQFYILKRLKKRVGKVPAQAVLYSQHEF